MGGTQSIMNLLYDSYMELPQGINYVPDSINYNDTIYIYHYAGNIKPWKDKKCLSDYKRFKYELWRKYLY